MVVVFIPTEESMTREFARMQRDLEQLAQRVAAPTDAQWMSGYSAQLFTLVDLGLLQEWEHPAPSPLLDRLGIAPAEIEHRAIQFRALRQWLEAYSEANG
jgi:hypothetical protein